MAAKYLAAAVACVLWIGVSRAMAQAAPFYYGTGTAVEPEIVTAMVGVEENIQRSIVSADRKYVTMDTDPQMMGPVNFRTFTYQQAGIGFVGGAAAQAAVMHTAGVRTPALAPGITPLLPTVKTSPDDLGPSPAGPKAGVLERVGMTRLAGLAG